MKRIRIIGIVAVLALLLVAAGFAYWHWKGAGSGADRMDLLGEIPGDPTAVIFLDFADFRKSVFLSQLFAWAPRPPVDADYQQFADATGFLYERDLDRVALAFTRTPSRTTTVAIADGRFDRKKIETYAAQHGVRLDQKGATVFAISSAETRRTSYFLFLDNTRVAWTDDPELAGNLAQKRGAKISAEWREHFERLGGSPIFGVIRQDDALLSSLAEQAPGGYRSPQLATLLGQLQWISIGGKAEGPMLRVAAEGECADEATMRDLNNTLSGLLILAQAGLNSPQSRKELEPAVRAAYLDLLKSADVEKVDRGSTKSVRIVFDITSALLAAARASALPGAAPPAAAPRAK